MLSPEYCAGFFDGEGWVNIYRSGSKKTGVYKYAMRCGVCNTFKEIIYAMAVQFGGKVEIVKENRKAGWKTRYTMYLYEKNSEAFLRFIKPFLRVKSAQVDLILEFINFKKSKTKMERCDITRTGWLLKPEIREREKKYYESMKELNSKGPKQTDVIFDGDRITVLPKENLCLKTH